MAAGWLEADAILPLSVFDNADLYGEFGQSGIWMNYSFVCATSTHPHRDRNETGSAVRQD